jgi:hypothetical protein
MILLKILGLWLLLSIVLTPILVPRLARRFRKHDEWIKEAEQLHRHQSVTPQVRMLRR